MARVCLKPDQLAMLRVMVALQDLRLPSKIVRYLNGEKLGDQAYTLMAAGEVICRFIYELQTANPIDADEVVKHTVLSWMSKVGYKKPSIVISSKKYK